MSCDSTFCLEGKKYRSQFFLLQFSTSFFSQVSAVVSNAAPCDCLSTNEIKMSNSQPAARCNLNSDACDVRSELNSSMRVEDFSLPPEDKRAIVTIMLLSFWYLGTSGTAAFLYTFSEAYYTASDDYARVKILRFLAILIILCSNSFNFLFYLRGKLVRETFRQRWVPRCLLGG